MNQESYPQQRATTEPAASQTSILAISSLIASILGLTVVPTLGSIIGLILGYVARREIRESPTLTGEGLAKAGIILGWIGVALSLIALFVALLVIVFGFVAIPGFTICALLSNGF